MHWSLIACISFLLGALLASVATTFMIASHSSHDPRLRE